MNFFQKKFLTLAGFIANISLTMVVAGVATYAWYTSNASATVDTAATSVSVSSTASNLEVDWEVIQYDYDQKTGLSFDKDHNGTEKFYLQEYDEYISQKNKFNNVFLHATVPGRFNAATEDDPADKLYVDVSCVEGHNPTYNNPAPGYTSNICQFKIATISYTDSSGVKQRVLSEQEINTTTTATLYNSATEYFGSYKKGSAPGTRFVSLHNGTPNKPSNVITLEAPSLNLESGYAKAVEIIIECSYTPKLVTYYLSSNSYPTGKISLGGDISSFSFRAGEEHTGSYVQVTNQDQLTTGNYIIAYDGDDDLDPALDGSITDQTKYGTNLDYFDVYSRRGRIANSEYVSSRDYSYNSSTSKLRSNAGFDIGGAGSGTSGTSASSQTNNLTNTLTYSGTNSTVSVLSNSKYLKYRTIAGTNIFNYYSSPDSHCSDPKFYKHKDGSDANFVLDHLTLSDNKDTLTYGSAFVCHLTINAVYTDGTTVDVSQDSHTQFAGYDTSILSDNQTVTVTYTDPFDNVSKDITYTLSVVNAPTGITVDVGTSETQWYVGETYDPTGIIVTLHYADGSFEPLTSSQYSVSTPDLSSAGTKTVYVSYLDYDSASFEITVSALTSKYEKVTTAPSDWSGTYLIVEETNGIVLDGSADSSTITDSTNYRSVTINNDFTIDSTSTIDSYSWVITQGTGGNSGKYSIKGSSNNLYINKDSNSNGIQTSSSALYNSISIESSSAKIVGTGSSVLRYNNSSNYFRYYKSSTYTGQKAIQLYKKVTPNPLSRIVLSDITTEYIVGDTLDYPTVKAYYRDGTSKSVTIDGTTCTISGYNMSQEGTQTVTVSYTDNGVTKTAKYTITVSPNAVTGVTLNHDTLTVDLGGTSSLTATISPSGATNKNVTWSVSNDSPANCVSVSNTGVVSGLAVGTATVTVTTEDGGYTDSCTVTVRKVLSSISVTTQPTKLTYYAGETFDPSGAVITANYNDSSTAVVTGSVSWSPTTLTAGTTQVTASYTEHGVKKTATVNVTVQIHVSSVSLDANAVTLEPGDTHQLTATVLPANATDNSVSWTSSNAGVATVSSSGLITVNANATDGQTSTITVTTTDGSYTDQCVVTVSVAGVPVTGVSLSSNAVTVAINGTTTLTPTISPSNATNTNVSWSTSNGNIATVSGGVVTGVAAGTATITVTTQDGGYTATCTVTVKNSVNGVTVSPASKTLELGGTQQLTATVSPDNATDKSVSWTSSNTGVATVNSSGLVTAQGVGTATITVTTTDGGYTATCAITVNAKLEFKNNGSDSNTSCTTSNFTDQIQSGSSIVDTVSEVSRAYPGNGGIKLGASGSIGYFVITSQKLKSVKTIKIKCKKYGSDTGKIRVYLNGSNTYNEITPPSTAGEITITLSSAQEITSIKVATSTKRAYVMHIIFNAS